MRWHWGRGKVRDFLQGNGRRKLIDWLAIDSTIDFGPLSRLDRIQGLVERLFQLLWAI